MRVDELLLVPGFHFETHHVECRHVTPPFVVPIRDAYRARLHAGRSPQRFTQSATRGWLSSLMPIMVPNISQLAAGISTSEKASSRCSRFARRACSASSPRMNCDRLYSAHALLRSSGLYENGVSSPW